MAVSYLTIATGTGSGNRLSFWSAQAVEKFTGLHNVRATAAIRELIDEGFVRLGENSSRTRPRHELPPHEGSDSTPANELIWLPNTLVTGTVCGERSPVGRLRSRDDMSALRLLVNLYSVQNLSMDGGISRKILCQEYERERCGERGRHVVWGFRPKDESVFHHTTTEFFFLWPDAEELAEHPIWAAEQTLREERLLQVVPHLVENPDPDSQPIHGFSLDGTGESLEQELGMAADAAGRHIIGQPRVYAAEQKGVQIFAPVYDTQPDVQMVGIYRLKYRPQTALTADWYRRMQLQAEEWMPIYKRIGPPKEKLYVA
jgi:hypothetical protein